MKGGVQTTETYRPGTRVVLHRVTGVRITMLGSPDDCRDVQFRVLLDLRLPQDQLHSTVFVVHSRGKLVRIPERPAQRKLSAEVVQHPQIQSQLMRQRLVCFALVEFPRAEGSTQPHRLEGVTVLLVQRRIRLQQLSREPRQMSSAAMTVTRSHTASVTYGRRIIGSPDWRLGSESNRHRRLCRPLHNHSAT